MPGEETARVWEAASGRLLHTLRHDGWVMDAVFSSDGTRVVTGGEDSTARIWNTASGELLHTLRGHTDTVYTGRFSPDGTRVATTSTFYDQTARIWDAASGRLLHTLHHSDTVNSTAFSPDGTLLLSEDDAARVWDAASGGLLHTLRHAGSVTSAIFSPNGTLVLSAGLDGTARIWRTRSGRLVHTLRRASDWVNNAVFSSHARFVLTLETVILNDDPDNWEDRGIAQIWKTASGRLLHSLRHAGSVTSAIFSPDGTHVLTGSADETMLWETTTGRLLRTVER